MSDDYRPPLSLRLANRLYGLHFPTYRTLYFAYKRWSDREFIRNVTARIRPGMTVLDVGANVGFYTRRFAHLVGPGGSVHAFEPEAQNFARLRKECAGLANVTLNHGAVGSENGSVFLALSKDVNVDHHVTTGQAAGDAVAVACTTLDAYCANFARLDVIKFDIQGGEWGAFQGMSACWSRFPRLLVYLEFWPYGLTRSGSSGSALLSHFAKLGLSVEVIEGPALSACGDDARPGIYTQLLVSKPT